MPVLRALGESLCVLISFNQIWRFRDCGQAQVLSDFGLSFRQNNDLTWVLSDLGIDVLTLGEVVFSRRPFAPISEIKSEVADLWRFVQMMLSRSRAFRDCGLHFRG